MKNLNVITNICDECIKEGELLLNTKWLDDNMGGFQVMNPKAYVDLEGYKKWNSNCNVLINMLGDLSRPWSELFTGTKANLLTNVSSMLGALRSIKESIAKGYLITIEDLVFAEAFSNLIDQAEYLFDQNYLLAAGVLGRAVLEEKLRALCSHQAIEIAKSKPTLADFNGELYKAKFYNLIEFKNIDHLISIGNNAAHNKPFEKEDIVKLMAGVKAILSKYN